MGPDHDIVTCLPCAELGAYFGCLRRQRRSPGRPPAALHRAFGPFAYHSTKCLQSGVNTYELSLFSNERQLFVRVETRAELDAWYHMGQLVAKENFLSRTEH